MEKEENCIKLTRENVNQIFRECVWPCKEWKDLTLTKEDAPDGSRLLLPLSDGANAVFFHPEKLKQYKKAIGELLDQVPILSTKVGISFLMLSHTVEETIWTDNPYEIQMLYLLGVVTDQLIACNVNGTISIGRIPEEKAIVDLIGVSEGKAKIIERRIGKEKRKEE